MDILKSFEVAKNIYFASGDEKILSTLETIFPQLKEQTDERIRKAIIEFFELQDDNTTYSFIPKKDILDWLYRQGSNQDNKCEYHKGDWLYDEVNKIFCVIKNERDNTYRLVDINGEEYDVPKYTLSYQYHRFTLKDAKDGDVLSSDNSIFIFQEEYIAKKPIAYCGLMNGRFIEGKDACWTNEKYYPATKEQRDLLFQKMKEAGYEWDDEKKELKKIESDELTDFEGALFTAFSDGWQQYLSGEEVNVAQWAKEHSAELLEVAKQNVTTWSEEDDNKVKEIIAYLNELFDNYRIDIQELNNYEAWCKSIKQRLTGKK